MNNKQLIGTNIRNLRLHLELTQEQFSEQVNLSTNYISQIESGTRGINVNNIIKICNKFNCTPSYIFKGTIDETNNISDEFDSLSPRDKLIIETLTSSLKDI